MVFRASCAGLVAVHAMIVLFGCESAPQLPAPDVQIHDSAGVRIVEVPPISAFSLPEWRTERVFSSRDLGGENVELYRVVDALFLADSSLVVANTGSSQLLIVQPDGSSYAWRGGDGDGPGEFRRLSRLLPASSGGFYAFDWRLSLFDADGEFVETRRLDPENRVVSVAPLAVLSDGRTVAVLGEQRIFLSGGERRDTVPLLVFPSESGAPDTLGTWLGLERAFARHAAGSLLVPIGFAKTAFNASNGTKSVIGSTDSLDLTVFSADLQPSLRIVSAPDPREPSQDDVRAWREYLTEHLPINDEAVRRAFEEGPVRERYPAFEGLEVDPVGRVWVGEYVTPPGRERRWIVFSPDGQPLGQVHVPVQTMGRLPGRTEILAVGPDRIAILGRNRMDEEYVEVWRFYPPEEIM